MINIFKNIPKILHLYWDYSSVSYLQYLTVESFVKYNPDWKVIIWQPTIYHVSNTYNSIGLSEKNNNILDFFVLFYKFKQVEFRVIDLAEIGFYNNVSEVFKADYFRYWALSEIGGVWSDFDIIYCKSLEDIKIGNSDIYGNVDEINTLLCTRRDINYFYIGFLGASKDNMFFKDVIKHCNENYNPNVHQSIGPWMINTTYKTCDNILKIIPGVNIANIPEDNIYSIKYEVIEDFFIKPNKLHDVAVCIHWFNGVKQIQKYIYCDYDGVSNSVLSKYFLKDISPLPYFNNFKNTNFNYEPILKTLKVLNTPIKQYKYGICLVIHKQDLVQITSDLDSIIQNLKTNEILTNTYIFFFINNKVSPTNFMILKNYNLDIFSTNQTLNNDDISNVCSNFCKNKNIEKGFMMNICL